MDNKFRWVWIWIWIWMDIMSWITQIGHDNTRHQLDGHDIVDNKN